MEVVLVSMPFPEVQRPSIALGLLQASLAGTDIQSEVVYGNFGLAERLGLVAYQAMQSAPTGHRRQAGLRAVQITDPRSIIPCV